MLLGFEPLYHDLSRLTEVLISFHITVCFLLVLLSCLPKEKELPLNVLLCLGNDVYSHNKLTQSFR